MDKCYKCNKEANLNYRNECDACERQRKSDEEEEDRRRRDSDTLTFLTILGGM